MRICPRQRSTVRSSCVAALKNITGQQNASTHQLLTVIVLKHSNGTKVTTSVVSKLANTVHAVSKISCVFKRQTTDAAVVEIVL